MTPVTSRVEYSPIKRARVYMKHEMGIPERRIALEEGISPGSVSGIIRRYPIQKDATSCARSGRPPKLSDRDKRAILRLIKKDPYITTHNLIVAAGLDVSKRTLLRWLKHEGIVHKPAF
ncbi:uncharacterized protein SAPINGB_P005098 [Magnusiomyces paraingens]|uniref:Transposase Tc1-like domain-containing protein n=1 Tax=Magnusiomyces paraingens TaxID=2606893 RepID=A0A5E8BXX0_9ASCO|nr:uncharacterized protein SAPINGB_P005098 [Saprochaete ingens]VVT56489.1 unnamed protein product [Saprochaete ingens]